MLDPRTLIAEESAREVDPQQATEVFRLARRMAAAKDQLDRLNEEIKSVRETHDRIRKDELPDAMHEAGMVAATGKGSFTLDDGRKVFLQADMHVSLPASGRAVFYDWLSQAGHGDLIVPHVHPSTLKAFCKEQLAEGSELPEVITTHPYLKAVLRKA